MSGKSRLICLLVCVCFFASCKKKGTDNTDVLFVNRLTDVVTVDVYSNMEDYKNSSNLFLRKTVPASDKIIVPGSTFEAGKTYYMDWYTDDYYHNNWFNDMYNDQDAAYVVIKPVAGDNTYFLQDWYEGKARQVYLDKTASSTTWQAVDCFLFSENLGFLSKWGELDEHDKYKKMVINKDFTAVYEYKDAQGNIDRMVTPFKVHHTKEAYIEFFGSDNKILGNMTSGRLPSGQAPDYMSSATDTVLALLPGKLDYYFLMVKK